MNKKLVFLIIVIVVIALTAVFYGTKDDGMKKYSDSVYGISFSYPSMYTIDERDIQGSDVDPHHQITLIRSTDLLAPENGEGPEAITIGVYKNPENKYTTESWIRTARESNFKLGNGTIASTTVSSMTALSYRWSGLYEGTTVAIARPAWVYAFSVTYLEMGAPIVQDFVKIRESVRIEQ